MLLSNYKEHPTKTNYLVFTYTNKEMADYFKVLLENQDIKYEFDADEYGNSNLYLFAVRTTHRNEAVKSNFLAYGKYRKPLFNNVFLRYFLLLLLLGLVFLGILGYLNSK